MNMKIRTLVIGTVAAAALAAAGYALYVRGMYAGMAMVSARPRLPIPRSR